MTNANETPVTHADARAALAALTGQVDSIPRTSFWSGILSHLNNAKGRAAIDADGYVRTWWAR